MSPRSPGGWAISITGWWWTSRSRIRRRRVSSERGRGTVEREAPAERAHGTCHQQPSRDLRPCDLARHSRAGSHRSTPASRPNHPLTHLLCVFHRVPPLRPATRSGIYLGVPALPPGPQDSPLASDRHDRTQLARTHPAPAHRRRDAAVVHQLLDERHRLPGTARRARRTQAGPPAHSLRDERAGPRPRPPLQEVRDRRRRRARQVPPARRPVGLRRARAHGAGLLAALSAGRRPGELRLGRRRSRGGLPLHRSPAHPRRGGDAGGHRQEHRRLPAQLRRPAAGADGPAVQDPQPAGQRLVGHRGRHGHQHPAAQPARSGQGGGAADRQPGRQHRGPPEAHQGPRLPDRRVHLRPRGHQGRLRDGPRPHRHARPGADRGEGVVGQVADRHHRDPLPGQQGEPGQGHRRAGDGEEDRGHQRRQRRVRQGRHAGRDRAQARRDPERGAQPALQAHRHAVHLRRDHAGARQGRPQDHDPQGAARALHRAPARGHRPAHPVRPQRAPKPASTSSKASRSPSTTSTRSSRSSAAPRTRPRPTPGSGSGSS